jgi:autotransporter-associated beta strand protein
LLIRCVDHSVSYWIFGIAIMNAKIWGRWVSRLFRERRRGRGLVAARRLAIETLEDRLAPATISWTGGGTNDNWANPDNWNLDRAPVGGDDLIFGTLAPANERTTVDNLNGLPVFNSITIAASGYVINGSPGAPLLALGGSLNAGSNLGTLTITIDMRLVPPTGSPQQTFTVNTGTTLVLSGHLSGNTNPFQAALQTVTKAGPGTLELTNDNSAYTGAFTLASGGGAVLVSHPNALGLGTVIPGVPTAGTVTVNPNSQLQLRNVGSPINARLTLNGTGVADNGALLNLAGNNTWAGSVTLDSDVSVGANAGSTVNISGLIGDTGSGRNLTKEGAGQLVLSRVGGNTYRGLTIVDNGILTIRDPISLGAGADFTKPQSGTPQAGTIVNFNSVTGEAGTLQFEHVPNTVPGTDPSAILQDPSQPFHPVANPVVGFQVFNDLITLNGPGFGNIGALSNLTGRNSWNHDVILGSPPPTPGTVSIGAATGSELEIEGVIRDPNRQPTLVKVLPGKVVFSNANTYRGGTEVRAGTLNIRDSQALGPPDGITIYPPGPATNVGVRDGATLELEVDQGLDGTPLRSHGRNLGFDSVRGDGPGQEIVVGGTGGTFTISFKGQTTSALPLSASPGQVEAALNALSTISAGGGSVSVTKHGSVFRVQFNGILETTNQPLMTATGTGGATAGVNAIYGLTVVNSLQAAGLGLNDGGALRSVSGINNYAGLIGLGDPATPALGSIGALRDPRPGHDTPDANYFTYDHSLTVTGEITDTLINPVPRSTLIKQGDGHVILPTENTYTDRTEIRAGWITAQNDRSLGFMNPVHAPTLRPYTTIAAGAALHIKPPGTASTATLTHEYDLDGSFTDNLGGPDITPNGGTLSGTNYTFGPGQGLTLTGAIASPRNYSIELTAQIDDLAGTSTPGWVRLIEFKNGQSDFGLYTIDGFLTFYDGLNLTTGPTLLTEDEPFVLLFSRDGGSGEVVASIDGVEQFRFFDISDLAVFDTPGNVAHFFIDNTEPPFTDENSGGVIDRIRIYDGVLSPPAAGINLINNFIVSGEGVIHDFGLLNKAGAIQNIGGNNTLSGIIQLNGQGGFGVEQLTPPVTGEDPSQLNLTGYLWDATTGPGGITKLGSRRLVIQAPGTYTGDVDIKAGVLLVQNDSALGLKSAPAGVSNEIEGLIHSYELNGSFNDTLGGPPLADNGGTLNDTNYTFGPGEGLRLAGALPATNHYSIEMVFRLDSLTGSNGGPWVNLIEFKDGQADTGLYSFGGALQFFDSATGPSGAFSAGAIATLLLTRDGTSGEVVGYVNGIEQIRFLDDFGDAIFSGPNGIINFFIDDNLIPDENAAGMVDRIRIFDRPLTPSQLNPSGNVTIVESGAALEIANSVVEQSQGLMGGLGIWGEHLVLHGQGNALFGDAALTILSDNSPATNLVNNPVFATDNAWRGPITLGSDTTIEIGPRSRLVVTGAIGDALNPLPSGSSLTVSGGGVLEFAGANSYRGSTIIQEGVLTVADGLSLGTSGNAEVQTVTLLGLEPEGEFTLTFNGKTTAPITYSGDGPTDAAAIQAALTLLTSIGGQANIAGSVSVTPAFEADTFDVELGGSLTGFNQAMMTGAVTSGPGAISITEKVAGSGGTEIDDGASLQLVGAITVAGEPLLVHGTGGASPDIPTQWFQVGPEGISNGQTPGAQRTTGRVTGSVADPRDPNIIYISTAGGGAWKTVDGGKTWRPLFDAVPEIQRIEVGTTDPFSLSFGGQSTAPLDGASPTLAADIQAALNGLSTVGGAGAHVIVTRAGNFYSVTFGGTLLGSDVSRILSDNPDVIVTTPQDGRDPRFGMFVGSITMHPINPLLPGGLNHPVNQAACNTLYLATGEANATGDSFYGTGIYVSRDAGKTWELLHGQTIQTVTVTGPSGTWTLEVFGETTSDLPYNASAQEVQDALNQLPSLEDGASVTRDGVQEVQQIEVTATSGTFILSFEGEDTVAIDAASPTLMADIENALNDLTTIAAAGDVTLTPTGTAGTFEITFGDVGDRPLITQADPPLAGVTITEVTPGVLVFTVTFVGSMADNDVPPLVGEGAGGVSVDVEKTGEFNPLAGQVISRVVVDPFSGTLYAASGDAIPVRNEVQQIRLFSFPVQSTITLTLTMPDADGNMVTQTTAAITINLNQPATQNALNIQNALNALPIINIIPNHVTASVTALGSTVFNVTFGKNLAGQNIPTMISDPPFPPNGSTRGIGIYVLSEGGVSNGNGSSASAPGIWRMQGGEWFNLTSVVSLNRSTVATEEDVPPEPGTNPTASPTGVDLIPNTPGPDDDYRLQFPQSGALWTDLALIYTDTTNNPDNGQVRPGAPVLYAALGTPAGSGLFGLGLGPLLNPAINNAVYWSQSMESDSPIWYVGDPGGSPYSDPPEAPEDPDARPDGFPRGQLGIPFQDGDNPPPSLPEIPLNGNIRLAGMPIVAQTGTEFATSTVFAAVSSPDGQLRSVYRTQNGGQAWDELATPAFLYSVGNFSNAIVALNANTVFIGGQGINAAGVSTIAMTLDGGGSWTDISIDGNGNGPHAGIHSLSLDSQSRLLASTDGGLWRREVDGTWTNLNGDLAISNVNSVSSDPTRTTSILAGAQANGIARFDNALGWTRLDGYGGGPVVIDPTNALNLYGVAHLTGTNAVLRKSVDGGINWTTALAIGAPNAPFVLDPVNSSRLLVGGAILRESLNQGATWTNLQVRIGTALIPNVRDFAIANAQGPFVVDPNFLQVTDQGANAYDPDTIYATDGNVIWLTKNHGQTWVNRTSTLTGLGSIVDIVVDPRNRDTIYAVRQASGGGQVFRSTDAGRTWIDISSNLPDVPASKVLIDPRNGFLYVGNDLGVFHSVDGGANWQRFGVGMPNTQVKDLELNLITNTLLAGTYGRSVYQMFLDIAETSDVPVGGVVRALGGTSIWAGNVVIDGDQATNSVTLGAFGVPDLPNSLPIASINFVGQISDFDPDRPGASITKVGQGDVIFSGANLYAGHTTVQEGALVVDNTHALGLNAEGTLVVDGAVLELRSNLDPEPVTLNGHGQLFNDHFTGSLRNVAGANTYTGPLTLATDATIGVDSGTELTIAAPGSINGSAVLTKESTGLLALGGANSTFTGETRVNQGVVRLENSNALGTTSNVRVLAGAQVQLSSPIAGSPVEVNVPLQLSGTGIFGTGALLNVGGDNAWQGPITLDTLPGFSAPSFPNGSVSFGATEGTLTVSGALTQTDAVGITKVGNGRVLLNSPANNYSGATEVLDGTLAIGDPGALGTRTSLESIQRVVTLSAGRTGTFRLGFNGLLTGNLPWAASTLDIEDALNSLPTIFDAGGVVTVMRAEIQTTNQDGPIPLQGGDLGFGYVYTITFGGSLTETALPLSAIGDGGTGAAASVVATGGINVRVEDGATLELAHAGAGMDVQNRKLTLSGLGDLSLGALFNSAGDNTWSGPVDLAADASIGALLGTSVTLSGGVTGAASELDVLAPGTVIFPAGSPTNEQQRTNIHDGTVQVDGEIGEVVLHGGTLAGTGQVGLVFSSGNGGTVNPGSPSDPTGTLTSDGGVLGADNTFHVDLVDAATADNDVLVVDNPFATIDLGFATLGGTSALDIDINDSFTILQTANPNGIIGRFAGFLTNPEAGGDFATIAYIDGVKYVVDYFPDHIVVTRELANVSIEVTPSVAAPVYGQPVTFTAVLTPEPGAPAASGFVTFTLDSDTFVREIVNGVATFDATENAPLLLGNHTIQVDYTGVDANNQIVFNPASAGPNPIVVAAANTTTTISASVAAPVFGQDIALTAIVESAVDPQAPNTLLPQGTVSFFDGSTLLGTVPLDATGSATFNTSTLNPQLPVGSHVFRAVYNSDGTPDNYETSTSSTVTRFISKASTQTSVVSSGSPTVFGQPVTFTATVISLAPGSGVPTGTVTFRANGALLGTGTVDASGIATYTTTAGQLPAGVTYNIVASYGGDGNYIQSSANTTQTVTRVNSTTTVTSSAPTAVFGQPVTFTATIAAVAPGGGIASGVVTFKRDGVVIGTGLVDTSGQAAYTTTFGQLPLGTGFVITAEYAGDINFNASSGSTTQNVINADSTTSVTSSAPTAVFGQPVTFTATVSPVPPGAGAPSGGTVTFTLGAVTLGTVPVDANGQAAYTTTLGQLQLGANQIITATFSGDAGFGGSSGTVSQTVNQASTTTSVAASFNPSGVDQSVTFTATVAPAFLGSPTGTVTFRVNGNLLGTGTLSTTGGVTTATFTANPNTLPLGSLQISAEYAGDSNFLASSGSASHTVLRGTSTALASSSNPSAFGQPVTFTATVTPTTPGGPALVGNVQFFLDGVSLGTVTLSGAGVANITVNAPTLQVGANQVVTAVYTDTSGSPVYAGSTGTVLQTVNQSNTTVTMSSSPSQGTRLRAIDFTVRVGVAGAGSGVPTGNVVFRDLTTQTVLGTAVLDAIGNATLTSHLGGPLGNHVVEARYEGDGSFGQSVDTVSVRIFANGPRTTAAVLRSSSNPSIVGSPVTFTATIRDTGPLPRVAPGGSVMFFNVTTGEVLGYGKLAVVATGITRASFTTSALPINAQGHEIQARYSGNATFARVNSAILEQVVKPLPTRTSSTTLGQSSAVTAFGTPITFTATVTDTGSGTDVTPTGTVTFTYGANDTVLGTATLAPFAPGVARALLITGELPVGVHQVRVTYNGDTDFAPGAPSSSVTHTVNKAASLLALTSTANPARFGQLLTWRATLTSSTGGGIPGAGGNSVVNFFVDGVQVGQGTINASGVATFSTSSLAVGSYAVTASFAGDANFNASNGTLAGGQTVNKAATTATLSRSTSEAGAPVTFTATILPVAPGGGVPTGTVTFVVDGINRGTFGMTNGIATLFLPNGLSQGSHSIVVKYSGGDNHNASNTAFTMNFGGRTS